MTFHRIDRGLVCSSFGTQDRTEEHAERPDVYVGEAFSRDGSQSPQPGLGTPLTAQDTVRRTLRVSGSPGACTYLKEECSAWTGRQPGGPGPAEPFRMSLPVWAS